MPSRPSPLALERHAPWNGVLWTIGGLTLLVLTFTSAMEGQISFVLALLTAGLAGVAILVRPEFGVLALTSTFFLSYPEVLQGSGRLTINNLLGLALAAILFVKVVVERRADFLDSRQVRWLLLIGLLLLINQALEAGAPPIASLAKQDLTERRVQDFLARLAYLVFFVAFLRTRWQILLLVAAIVGFVLVTSPGAIANALGGSGGATGRAAADFGITMARNANRLAFVCALAIAFIGHAALEFRSRTWATLAGVAILLLSVTIFFSASRSGLINLVLVFLFLLAQARPTRRQLVVLVLLLAVSVGTAFVVVPTASLERITSFLETEGEHDVAGSTRSRLDLLQLGWRMFLDHPLTGIGIGNFRWVSLLEYQWDRSSAMHNSYLLALVEGGLVLLVAYLLLFRIVWKDLAVTRRAALQTPEVGLGWLVLATRTAFILFLVFSFFADVWYEATPYIVIGLSVVLGRLYRNAAAGQPA
jgi:O-antigen ligase